MWQTMTCLGTCHLHTTSEDGLMNIWHYRQHCSHKTCHVIPSEGKTIIIKRLNKQPNNLHASIGEVLSLIHSWFYILLAQQVQVSQLGHSTRSIYFHFQNPQGSHLLMEDIPYCNKCLLCHLSKPLSIFMCISLLKVRPCLIWIIF